MRWSREDNDEDGMAKGPLDLLSQLALATEGAVR
jgi:hypothetical protein